MPAAASLPYRTLACLTTSHYNKNSSHSHLDSSRNPHSAFPACHPSAGTAWLVRSWMTRCASQAFSPSKPSPIHHHNKEVSWHQHVHWPPRFLPPLPPRSLARITDDHARTCRT